MTTKGVDGDNRESQKEYDWSRAEQLNALGITVIRHSNKEVMTNTQGVYEDLKKKITYLSKPPQSPFSGGGK